MHRCLGVVMALVLAGAPAVAQQLGDKVIGSLGLYIGTQTPVDLGSATIRSQSRAAPPFT